jgi:hypothetical protein
MAMGSYLCQVVCNIYMEYFEILALDTTERKPAKWLRYVDDTFVIWPHGVDKLHKFLHHIDNLRLSIPSTMEMESNNHLPILDVLVTKMGLPYLPKCTGNLLILDTTSILNPTTLTM